MVSVVVDVREPEYFVNLVRFYGTKFCKDFSLKKEFLPSGDYLVSENLVIERKTISDFFHSYIGSKKYSTKRLVDQLELAKKVFGDVILLVHGSYKQFFVHSKAKVESLFGMIVSISSRYKTVLLTNPISEENTDKEAAKYIVKLALFLQSEEGSSLPKTLNPTVPYVRSNSKEDVLTGMLTAIPKVGPIRAYKLVERFGSMEALTKASVSEIAKTIGSTRIAEIVYEYLH